MKTLIIANGELPAPAFIEASAAQFDLVFVTEGAASRISPTIGVQYICGDFDSIDAGTAKQLFPRAEIVPMSDQNRSDIEKTLLFSQTCGAGEISIIGALGGRVDHSLVLLALMTRYHRMMQLSFIDQNSEMIILSPDCVRQGRINRECKKNETVSLISFELESVVTISGVYWPLTQSAICAGSQGVSNRASGGQVQVEIHRGVVAVCLPLK